MTPALLEHTDTGTEVPFMTDTDTQDLSMLDVGEVNFDAMGPYEAPSNGFGVIAPGRYLLEMPTTLNAKVIEIGGVKAIEVDLEGLRIADNGQPHAKQRIFNAKVTTLPIKAKGKALNASDAWDLLLNFGLATKEKAPTGIEFQHGMEAVKGQVTPQAVEVTLKGSAQIPGLEAVKGRNSAANAKGWVTFYAPMFRNADGTYNATADIETPTGAMVTVKAKAAIGWRGWAPVKAATA